MTMKRIKFSAITILSVMLIAFTGCNREDIEITPDILLEGVTISASIDLDDTKVNYEDQLNGWSKVNWNLTGENISMVYSTSAQNEILFSKNCTGVGRSASFGTTSTLPNPNLDNVYFIYPGHSGIKTNHTDVAIDFSNQDGTEAGAATKHLMVADYGSLTSWSGVNLMFQNKVALMKLTFKHDDFKNKTIPGVSISGTDLMSDGNYNLSTGAWSAGAGSTDPITLSNSFSANANGEFTVFFAIIPSSISNLMATVQLAGKTYQCTITNAVNLTSGKIYIKGPLTMTPLPGGFPVTNHKYVGAYWKAMQTGERLIVHPVATGETGPWSVSVLSYGSTGFMEGDIVFSTAPSIDPLIYTSGAADMNTYDAAYQVTGGYSVSGNAVNVGDYITFRIGLTSTLGDATSDPRYAVVRITYGGGKTHDIYLRQGEEADYVFRPTDTYGSPPVQRAKAVKWSPYNITAPEFIAGSHADYHPVSYKSGVPTNYPSQAGALFQMANQTNPRYAYRPTGMISTIDGGTLDGHWDMFASIHDVCPSGYRRFDIGPSILAQYTEFYQSLSPGHKLSETYPQPTTDGWYADGFSDRREMQTGDHARADGAQIAYIGKIVINDASLAHIFVPYAGYLVDLGIRQYVGERIGIWTGSGHGDYMYHVGQFTLKSSKLEVWRGSEPGWFALTMRCVRI